MAKEEPTEEEMPKKKGRGLLIGIAVLVALIIVSTAVEQHEINKERLRPRFAPAVVKTLSFSLQHNDRIVFSTADPVTGQLCQYTVNWKRFTKESKLTTSIHNHLGSGGVGGRKNSSYTTPWRNNNLLGGDEKNRDTYYVTVHNHGPDKVEFTVDLIGERQVSRQVALEE